MSSTPGERFAAMATRQTATQQSEQEFIQRAQAGEAQAFEFLVVKYRQRISRLLTRIVGNDEEVLDLTQDVFIRAYQALPGFRGDSVFYTWLYRIAVNTARNYIAVRARRPVVGLPQEGEPFWGEHHLMEHTTPEHILVGEEIRSLVDEAFEALPDELRTALLLREIENMSYDQISKVMECPVGTVRSRIFRAREAILKQLQPVIGGGNRVRA